MYRTFDITIEKAANIFHFEVTDRARPLFFAELFSIRRTGMFFDFVTCCSVLA